MSRNFKNKIVDTVITRFSLKGNGLGEFTLGEGHERIVEVPFTMPGEEVQAQIFKKRAGKFKGTLSKIVKESPQRVSPKCSHFGVCGGCRWQHVPYSSQLEEKQGFVEKLFEPMLGDAPLHPIIACDPPWNYRNKMEFTFSSDASENRYLGLIMDSSRGKVFNLLECHLPSPWFAEVLASVRDWWEKSGLDAYHPHKDRGSLRTLTMREGSRSGEKMVMLTVSGNPDYSLHGNQLKGFVEAVKKALPGERPSLFLIIQQISKGHTTQFYEVHLSGDEFIREKLTVSGEEMAFQISPRAFFQPNTAQAEKIYRRVLEMSDIGASDVVYDLYCGTGTLGLIMAKKAKQVIGIELSPEAVLDARENAKINGCENIEFYKGDVGKVLSTEPLPEPDIIACDPPRAGLDKKALETIGALKAQKIVYVSCNPRTQADNVDELIKMGYHIKAVQPVDQFPHTIHMENIVLLCRSNF